MTVLFFVEADAHALWAPTWSQAFSHRSQSLQTGRADTESATKGCGADEQRRGWRGTQADAAFERRHRQQLRRFGDDGRARKTRGLKSYASLEAATNR